MKNKTHAILKKASLWAVSALVILLAVRYLLPLFWPFLLAFTAALLIDPIILRFRRRFHLRRSFASAFLVTLFLAAFLGCAIFAAARLGSALSNRLTSLPEMLGGLDGARLELGRQFSRITSALPETLSSALLSMLEALRQQALSIPARLISALSSAAAKAPSILFSVLMMAISLYFISADLPAIKSFILRQLPQRIRDRARTVKADFISTLKGWGKAQLRLMLICFAELSAAFLIMRLRCAIPAAAAIALIDALPVFGTGIVLLPWAAMALLAGNYRRAIILALTYAAVSLARSCLEPRLLGQQTGLHPAAALIALYVGQRLAGIPGMLLFPLLLMLLKQFNDRGWLRLWQ